MNSPTRDHLLGYLLKALAPDEQEQVETELNQNPSLRAELRQIESRLGRMGLGNARDYVDPPAGLAERTCQYVSAHAARPLVSPGGTLVYQSAERERRFTWSDFVTMAAVIVAAASLFFPALSFSRFQAQIATCQNQLRLIGFGLHGYSDLQADRSFPGPEAEGPRAAAGIVAPMLVSHRLADPKTFLCPAPINRPARDFHMPSLEELDRATGQELKMLHEAMGGDFGYNMGFVEDGRLVRASNARRGKYVLAGDRPSDSQPRRVSGNHRGRGQNLLYEDGRVQFLPQLPSPQVLDDPYHNRDGWVAPGVDRDDAVLGASADHPMPVKPSDDR
jgi:hypothetical protein